MDADYDYDHPELHEDEFRRRLCAAIQLEKHDEIKRLFSPRHLLLLEHAVPARDVVWLLENGYLHKNGVYKVTCRTDGTFFVTMAHVAVMKEGVFVPVPDVRLLLNWLVNQNAHLDIRVQYADFGQGENHLTSPLDLALTYGRYCSYAAALLLKAGVDTHELSASSTEQLQTRLFPRREACRSALIAMLGARPRSPYFALGKDLTTIIARVIWPNRYHEKWDPAVAAQKKARAGAGIERNE